MIDEEVYTPKGKRVNGSNTPAKILSQLFGNGRDWYIVKLSNYPYELRASSYLKLFDKKCRAKTHANRDDGDYVFAFEKQRPPVNGSGGGGGNPFKNKSDGEKFIVAALGDGIAGAKPSLVPTVIILTPPLSSNVDVNDTKYTKDYFEIQKLEDIDTPESLVEEITGKKDLTAIVEVNYLSYKTGQKIYTGDLLKIASGRAIKLDGSVENANVIDVSVSGAFSYSTSVTIPKPPDNTSVSWDTEIPISAIGKLVITAVAGGASHQANLVIADKKRLISNNLILYYGTDDWKKLKEQAKIDLGIDNPSDLVSPADRITNFQLLAKNHIVTAYYDPAAIAVYNADYVLESKEPVPDYSFVIPPDPKYDAKYNNTSDPLFMKIEKYANTDYGAKMVREILTNPSLSTISVALGSKFQASGSDTFIVFPVGFPKRKYMSGGENVDELAVIHHEFGHTIANPNLKGTTKATLSTAKVPSSVAIGGDIKGERQVVRELDNPVRILNGNEPRYTYWEDESNETINIITGATGSGKMTFDPKNATKLIKRTKAQAALWK